MPPTIYCKSRLAAFWLTKVLDLWPNPVKLHIFGARAIVAIHQLHEIPEIGL